VLSTFSESNGINPIAVGELSNQANGLLNGEGCEELKRKGAFEQPHQQQNQTWCYQAKSGKQTHPLARVTQYQVLAQPAATAHFNGRAHQTGDNPIGMATNQCLWVVMGSESDA